MKCKKCGAEIPDGNLYCEKCGEEITIVPLFEPELETQIVESLHRISDEVSEQTASLQYENRRKKYHYLRLVILMVLISLIIGVLALIYLINSSLYQLNRANSYIIEGDYEEAINHFEQALAKEPDNYIDIYMYMIDCYEKLGYDGQYEEYLLRVISSPDKTETQEFIAYSKLIQLYREGNSFQTINILLKNCNSDKIKEQFKNYLVTVPVFHYEEGVYNEIIPLKITSTEGYSIYYTLDGSEPTKESLKYTEPIFLDNGFYEFRAVCMNDYGVYSDIITKKYEIIFADK
ncbi:MAG: chitobiase/beta-hexosaminidase C-terminal domain-containing protein [Lachnospiraceae bacterium]|nr:chitobiase/beta-hexosaminidase C-terminal domain-containing protein [Lachnospiraceae bacterium]